MRASNEKKNITHIQKLKEALGKSNDQSQKGKENSDKQSVQFIDENDESLREFESDYIMCSQNTEPVDETNYACAITENNGIAAPRPLSQDELEKQFDLLMTAPTDNVMTLHRGRFKAGHLQILVSFVKLAKDQTSEEARFWWNTDTFRDNDELVERILFDKLIPVTGTPKKLLQILFM